MYCVHQWFNWARNRVNLIAASQHHRGVGLIFLVLQFKTGLFHCFLFEVLYSHMYINFRLIFLFINFLRFKFFSLSHFLFFWLIASFL